MNTIYFEALTPENIARAADIICAGGLLGIPTETVYGLGANALDEEAVLHIFEAKGRRRTNPLIIHVPDASWLERYCENVPEAAYRLAENFWPGPLTMILPAKAHRAASYDGRARDGRRALPRSPGNHSLSSRSLAFPSPHPPETPPGGQAPRAWRTCARTWTGKIDAIFDGGPCRVGVESTIIDLTCQLARLLRPAGCRWKCSRTFWARSPLTRRS